MDSIDAMRVDPTNVAQARAWDGTEGEYWAANAQRFDASLAAYQGQFLDAASIGANDRILDIGCGTGQTTRDAARAATSGWALGVDLSARMIALARRLAADEGIANARFEQGDAQIYPFEAGGFDVAISRTGAMFFGDPVAAFRNLAGSLRPGGRLTLLVWQDLARNQWIREFATTLAAGRDLPTPPPDSPGPFALADPARIRELLTTAGFAGIDIAGLTAPMSFGRDVDDASRFILGVAGWMLEGLDEAGRSRALADLHMSLTAHSTGQGVFYDSATWLITAYKS